MLSMLPDSDTVPCRPYSLLRPLGGGGVWLRDISLLEDGRPCLGPDDDEELLRARVSFL